MSIGYACLNIGVNNINYKTCILKNANEENLLYLIKNNLQSLENAIEYNYANSINLFRINSEIIPFASNPINQLDWPNIFKSELANLGEKIINYNQRVSMHLGPYSILNSPNEEVVKNTIKDLSYHARFLDSMNLPPSSKMIIHIGGVYGDKPSAIKRFIDNYVLLDDFIKARLIIENDDRSYTIEEVLYISSKTGIPVVFDNLHNEINESPGNKSEFYWIDKASKTWNKKDGKQKIHYSQQNPLKNIGAHSLTIDVEVFINFYQNLSNKNIDIMLEVKDKNVSAIKCINVTSFNNNKDKINLEWLRYKYLILEKDPLTYSLIKKKIKSNSTFTSFDFYKLIQESLKKHSELNNILNAAKIVLKELKNLINEKEVIKFNNIITKIKENKLKIVSIKNYLLKLAKNYNIDTLLYSYYFELE